MSEQHNSNPLQRNETSAKIHQEFDLKNIPEEQVGNKEGLFTLARVSTHDSTTLSRAELSQREADVSQCFESCQGFRGLGRSITRKKRHDLFN